MAENCPTCGASVRIGGEGTTHYYTPMASAALAMALDRAEARIAALEAEIDAAWSVYSEGKDDTLADVMKGLITSYIAETEESHGLYLALTTAEQRIAALEAFVRDCATGFDCDTGANGSHPHYCRQCQAEALLTPTPEAGKEAP